MRKSAVTHENSAGLGATVKGYIQHGIDFLLGGEEAKNNEQPGQRKSVSWNLKKEEEYLMKPRGSRKSVDKEELQ
jgi:hypothetical protein